MSDVKAALYDEERRFVREVRCDVDGLRIVPHLNPDTDKSTWTLLVAVDGKATTFPAAKWLLPQRGL